MADIRKERQLTVIIEEENLNPKKQDNSLNTLLEMVQ